MLSGDLGGGWQEKARMQYFSKETSRAACELCFEGQSIQHIMYNHSIDRHLLTVNGCCCWSGFKPTVDHANSVNITI
jgi:hypothetical protein